jgi:WD40 repeat protein
MTKLYDYFFSGSADKTIRLWHAVNQNLVLTLTGTKKGVRSLTTLPNGYLASGSENNDIIMWEIK